MRPPGPVVTWSEGPARRALPCVGFVSIQREFRGCAGGRLGHALAASVPTRPEPWLRGPVPGVPPALQPVAHALQQAAEDVAAALAAFPDERLWERPAGVASVGFHLRHIAGVLDRMATYTRAEALSPAQFAALAAEEPPSPETTAALVSTFEAAVETMTSQLRATDPATLFEARGVGRQALPSTVIGVLIHAAEHTQRHVGQLLVTARVVAATPSPPASGSPTPR